jgi:hypothetical protein
MITDIFEINRTICFNLWDMVDVHSEPRGLSPRLILPEKRNKDIRISEQESRILYYAGWHKQHYVMSRTITKHPHHIRLG